MMVEGKKVLLTGLTGRIGGAIANRFAPLCNLWGLSRFSSEAAWDAAIRLGITPVRGDYAAGEFGTLPTDFDYVIHVAADNMPPSAESGMRSNSDGAALLMKHCRAAKAFLHVSTGGVYRQNPDPYHVYPESDGIGGTYNDQYTPTKLAGEGAVRAACLILEVPTVICRQNVQYGGPNAQGGLIDMYLDMLVDTGKAYLPPEGPNLTSPIHEDDICDLVEPSLGIASVPASIVNWCGDEGVDWEEMFTYAGRLIGREPEFVRTVDFCYPNNISDPAKRRAIAGPCKVGWKEGVRRTLALRHPELALNEAA